MSIKHKEHARDVLMRSGMNIYTASREVGLSRELGVMERARVGYKDGEKLDGQDSVARRRLKAVVVYGNKIC